MGCFAYSPVEGAKANELPGPVPQEVREERRARLMRRQEKISARRMKRKIGTTLRVLVDEVKDGRAIARSSADAPGIDGVVNIDRAGELKAGDWADVKVFKSGVHDLWARAVNLRSRAAAA